MREGLRTHLNVRKAKFVIDVLVYEDDPGVKKAMQYITNTVLLGETPLDARDLAYNLNADERFDAICLIEHSLKRLDLSP